MDGFSFREETKTIQGNSSLSIELLNEPVWVLAVLVPPV